MQPDDQEKKPYSASLIESIANSLGLSVKDLATEYKATEYSICREWLLARAKTTKPGGPKWVDPRRD